MTYIQLTQFTAISANICLNYSKAIGKKYCLSLVRSIVYSWYNIIKKLFRKIQSKNNRGGLNVEEAIMSTSVFFIWSQLDRPLFPSFTWQIQSHAYA